jgi:hypothetical protein
MQFPWQNSLKIDSMKHSKEFEKELDEIRQSIEEIPSAILKAELQAASSSLEGARMRLAALDDRAKRWAKQLKFTDVMVLLEDTSIRLGLERKRLESYLMDEYRAIHDGLEGSGAECHGNLLSRVENAIDLCARAGLNTLLVTYASLKDDLMGGEPCNSENY